MKKKANDLIDAAYDGVPATSLMTRQHIYDNRHAKTSWLKPGRPFIEDDADRGMLVIGSFAVILAFITVLL